MPLGITRLVLSTSAIRRFFGGIVGNLEYLTTQDGRTLQDQDFRFIAVEQSDIITDEAITALFDPLTTQAGDFIATNQNPNIILVLTQDFETAGDTFITQAGETLITQDNRVILTQRES